MSFVGRRRELAGARKKLADGCLVTLVGPGGVGKTRLAVRLAADLARGFRDGAWLVELGELRDPALVAHTAMAALDLRDQAAAEPRELLLRHLRDAELLLVVDNREALALSADRDDVGARRGLDRSSHISGPRPSRPWRNTFSVPAG
jgi:predicted ATPase